MSIKFEHRCLILTLLLMSFLILMLFFDTKDVNAAVHVYGFNKIYGGYPFSTEPNILSRTPVVGVSDGSSYLVPVNGANPGLVFNTGSVNNSHTGSLSASISVTWYYRNGSFNNSFPSYHCIPVYLRNDLPSGYSVNKLNVGSCRVLSFRANIASPNSAFVYATTATFSVNIPDTSFTSNTNYLAVFIYPDFTTLPTQPTAVEWLVNSWDQTPYSANVTNQDIIDNANQNTDDIISNNNDNQQQTNERLDEINDTLTDSNVSIPSDSFSDFNSSIATNGNITNLVLLPVTLFTKLAGSISGQCNTYSFGSLYGKELYLPCVKPEDYLGSTIWTFVDVVSSSFMLFYIAKAMYKAFSNFSNLKEGGELD